MPFQSWVLKSDLFAVQISTTIVGFMDVKDISPEASARLYTDMLAGEKSILRKVFGIIYLSNYKHAHITHKNRCTNTYMLCIICLFVYFGSFCY